MGKQFGKRSTAAKMANPIPQSLIIEGCVASIGGKVTQAEVDRALSGKHLAETAHTRDQLSPDGKAWFDAEYARLHGNNSSTLALCQSLMPTKPAPPPPVENPSLFGGFVQQHPP